MDDLCERIERAALLHDIGKLVQRANAATGTHAEAGVTFLERFAEDADRDILRAVGHHHADDLKNLRGTADDISYIVYEADNLAAASDRRTLEEGGGGFVKPVRARVAAVEAGEPAGFVAAVGAGGVARE